MPGGDTLAPTTFPGRTSGARRHWHSMRWLLLGVVVAAAISGAVILSISSSPSSLPRVSATPASVCREMDVVQRSVVADRSASLVLRQLAEVRSAAARLSKKDSAWYSLRSGIDLVDSGVRSDNFRQTQLGISIARSDCRRLGG